MARIYIYIYNAVFGELGWLPFWVRAEWQAIKYWTRIIEMSDECIVKEALFRQLQLLMAEKECWLMNIKNILYKVPLGKHRWKSWVEAFEANRTIECTSYTVNVSETTGKVEIEKTRWEDELYKSLEELSIDRWNEDINRNESVNSLFGNKFRTYCRFKDR